uniref:NADH dehydrogenase subunit 3 n=1 Tax=Vignadula atrata TaxID=1289577 RepID=UPI001FA78D84|nr:NADH dehydrogenase subunit 3 [Vignadula atrata]ULT46705.1 NADH dehydrogenase subunit 3 [Vignadula atrata]
MILFVAVSFFLILSFFLMSLCMFFFMKKQWNRDKLSPYECGFEPILSARSSFSLRFFLLAVLFVVFDVEIVALIPIVYGLSSEFEVVGVVSIMVFLLVLSVGCLYERRDGSMDWVSEK